MKQEFSGVFVASWIRIRKSSSHMTSENKFTTETNLIWHLKKQGRFFIAAFRLDSRFTSSILVHSYRHKELLFI